MNIFRYLSPKTHLGNKGRILFDSFLIFMAVSTQVLKDQITLIAKKTRGPPKISYSGFFQDREESALVSLNYRKVKDSNVDS